VGWIRGAGALCSQLGWFIGGPDASAISTEYSGKNPPLREDERDDDELLEDEVGLR
jgi:hypothetical protein